MGRRQRCYGRFQLHARIALEYVTRTGGLTSTHRGLVGLAVNGSVRGEGGLGRGQVSSDVLYNDGSILVMRRCGVVITGSDSYKRTESPVVGY